jgi:hypothetical protein
MTAYPSWTALTPGTTLITAAHWNEVKSAVDHMTETLGVAAYSWSRVPVAQYAVDYKIDVDEYRTGVNYVDTSNTNVAFNAAKNGTVDAHNTAVDAHNTSINASNYANNANYAYCGAHNGSVWGGFNSAV